MKIFLYFLFSYLIFISCNTETVKKSDNECSKNHDCKPYNFCIKGKCFDYSANKFKDFDELYSLSIANFIIMSDNKGDSVENENFNKMVQWQKKYKSKFIIGLGDHLKINRDNK
jgi:hypothetical protein